MSQSLRRYIPFSVPRTLPIVGLAADPLRFHALQSHGTTETAPTGRFASALRWKNAFSFWSILLTWPIQVQGHERLVPHATSLIGMTDRVVA